MEHPEYQKRVVHFVNYVKRKCVKVWIRFY